MNLTQTPATARSEPTDDVSVTFGDTRKWVAPQCSIWESQVSLLSNYKANETWRWRFQMAHGEPGRILMPWNGPGFHVGNTVLSNHAWVSHWRGAVEDELFLWDFASWVKVEVRSENYLVTYYILTAKDKGRGQSFWMTFRRRPSVSETSHVPASEKELNAT